MRPLRRRGLQSPMICCPTHATIWRAFRLVPLAPHRIMTPSPESGDMKRLPRTASVPASSAYVSARTCAVSSCPSADSRRHCAISASRVSLTASGTCRSVSDTENPWYRVRKAVVTRLTSLRNSTATLSPKSKHSVATRLLGPDPACVLVNAADPGSMDPRLMHTPSTQ